MIYVLFFSAGEYGIPRSTVPRNNLWLALCLSFQALHLFYEFRIQNIMTKKDRIAIVVSVTYILFIFWFMAIGGQDDKKALMLFLVVFYWGYRFIQGDISFIGKNRA